MWGLSYLASRLAEDKTIMKKHKGKLLPPLDSADFKRRRDNFCNMLDRDIERINIDTYTKAYKQNATETVKIVG